MLISSWQVRLILSGVLVTALIGCSSGAKQEGNGTSGTTQNSGNGSKTDSKTDTGSGDQTADDDKQTDTQLNVADVISKMTWKPGFYNNFTGKIYTGYNGTTPFKVLVDVSVYGELPKDVQDSLTEAQLQTVYTSKEYEAKMKAEGPKVSFQADTSFVSMKIAAEYPYGRVYELTPLKTGSATAKGLYNSQEVPLSITIASYTVAQVTAGRNRYNNAVTGATPSPSCASCHRQATGADHSPYFMAGFSDAALLSTIETGKNSDDDYQTSITHKMTFANATDKAGIVAYLRSLDPNLLPAEQKDPTALR